MVIQSLRSTWVSVVFCFLMFSSATSNSLAQDAGADVITKRADTIKKMVGSLPDFLNNDEVRDKGVDLSVPESPAFTALGLTPQEVIRPSSPRALATELLNGVDANGNPQNGLALDMSPFLLIRGDGFSLQDYQKDTFNVNRLLARTQLSIATAKGASDDDEAIRASLGLRLTPWDLGDPRMNEDLYQRR